MGDEAADVEALDLLPVGTVAPETFESIVGRLSRAVGVPCHRLPPRDELRLHRLSGRAQLDARVLLEDLEGLPPAPGRLMVGITGEDLGVPVFTFVFGLARTGGRASVVSLARVDPAFYGLPPDPVLRERRAVAEIRHELGHVCGLDHCPDRSCLMSFAGSIEKADTRGDRFCHACASRLPRWLRGPEPRPGVV
jgi:predicted Zn-dependent protease